MILRHYVGWRTRRNQKRAEQCAYLSDPERAEVARLREEHNPLKEMGGRRVPPQTRGRW